MAELYSENEFLKLNTPGFRSPATVGQALALSTNWNRILSVSFFTEKPPANNPGGEPILHTLAMIRQSATNRIHPDVLSTPTVRIPASLARHAVRARANLQILSDPRRKPRFQLDEFNARKTAVAATFAPNIHRIDDPESDLGMLTTLLLCKKFEVADRFPADEWGPLPEKGIGILSLKDVVFGMSYAADQENPSGGEPIPLWEGIAALGVVALVDHDLFPTETASYRNITWTPVDLFREGVKSRQVETVIPDLSQSDLTGGVCARGVCLETTVAVTNSSMQLAAHLGLNV